MKLALQRPLDQFVASGGQLALLAFGLIAHTRIGASPALWIGVLALIAALSLYGWVLALRRRRIIVDTPTARVATAPQGFVELVGRGRLFDGHPVASPLTGLPCLWYRYRTEQKNADNKWEVVQERQSDDSIILADDSGEAVIDPERAEVITRHRERWHQGDFRHTEWKLIAGDPLYVLGELKTIGGHSLDLDVKADMAQLLVEWKRDRNALHERFDLDADGQIDPREWALARSAARREVARAHREARERADAHIVRAPSGDRPFLIANVDPDDLVRRFGWWSLAHATGFVASLAAIPWVLSRL